MTEEPKSPFQQLREAANNSNWDEMRRLIKTHDFNRHLISAHFRSLKSDGMPSDIYHYLLDKHDSSLATSLMIIQKTLKESMSMKDI